MKLLTIYYDTMSDLYATMTIKLVNVKNKNG